MSYQEHMLALCLHVVLAKGIDAAGVQPRRTPRDMRIARGFNSQRTLGSRRFEEKT
jgi:hypothetical protein